MEHKLSKDITGSIINGVRVLQLVEDNPVATKQKYRVECCRCHGVMVMSKANILYTRKEKNAQGCKLCVNKPEYEKKTTEPEVRDERIIDIPAAAHKIISFEPKKKPINLIDLGNDKNPTEADLKRDRQYLEFVGMVDVLRNKFKEIIPDEIFDFYLDICLKNIHSMMDNLDFFVNMKENVLCEFKKAVEGNLPVKEKIVKEVKERVKVETVRIGSDRPLDSIYNPERVLKEYPNFFKNLLQVNNFIKIHLNKLNGHVLQVGSQYIVDETGMIMIMELADKTEETYPIEKKEEEPVPITVKPLMEVAKDIPIEPIQSVLVPIIINESLLDKSKKATVSIEKCKALYNRNRALYDSLNAFRHESNDNQVKVGCAEDVFDDYCNDKNRKNENKYLIKSDDSIVRLVIKKTDFDIMMEEFFKANHLFTKVNSVITQWRSFGFIEKNKDLVNPNSYILNYTKIKDFINEKGGLLNTIEFMD